MAVVPAGVVPGVLPGLDNEALTLLFVGLAIVALLWGFDRYRTTFSKTEFGLALALAIGLLTVGLAPGLYGALATAFNLESRFLLIQIFANATFLFLILYLVSRIGATRAVVNDLTRELAVEQAPLDDDPDRRTVYVVIPAYNEADTVGDVLDSFPETVRDHVVRAVVVSDGSDDRTRRAAEARNAIVVEHPLNQGQGGALKTGFEIARKHGADVVVTMDADGQHPVDQLDALVSPVVDGDADYVMGSRYRGRDRSGNSITRRGGIRAFTWLINRLTRADITDCTNGYRAIRGDRLGELTLTEERFSAPELIIEARKNGLRIREVPVTIREREAGETKKPGLGYAVGLARTIVVTWIR
ncbi:glycosyltransferase family 2 protein [Halosimplex pelagicum]|uniref:Glycosyltransferase family 2 protein n=1 Tax=Halosimplex pelagicum TaxID=869886 RepID=A0A7D5P5F6_9EURY|nr:glycosyltransferase family 2 protein [Halosimplex pelagicum]QLH81357.1 glycosyltransferase family 2 protein [Halosimplex pelagicum]